MCRNIMMDLPFLVLRSLAYFDDADEEPSPKMHKNVDWNDIKEKITSEVQKNF